MADDEGVALDAFADRHGLSTAVVIELVRLLDRVRAREAPSPSPSEAPTLVEDGWSFSSMVPSGDPFDDGETIAGAFTTDRYEDLGALGEGGMGEVRRVRDTVLRRTLAMKIAHPALATRPAGVERFLEEARATAQLQHPNIVPVHDLGTLPDGRAWFTMKEVRGRTLASVTHEVHAASTETWGEAPSGWTLRRLLSAFHAVCQGVAHAHDRGVVHRDLKPENAMVGVHGEVYVLDWGLAKLLGERGALDLAEPIESTRSGVHATRTGQVAGTPAYMPPEQARGAIDEIDARSDVYALGAMLWEILTGRPPYEGDPRSILGAVLAGPPPPPGRADLPIPEALAAVCARAMARDPAARFPHAGALAAAVQAWLDGADRRERALAVVQRAADADARAEVLRAEASALRARAEALLAPLPPDAPEDVKAEAWEEAERADAVRLEADLATLAADQALQAALQFDPELPEAHAALTRRYLARHGAAEAARDRAGAARFGALVREHVRALPRSHPTRLDAVATLDGTGALTLHTDPPGAEVWLSRFATRRRRLVREPAVALGNTPLDRVPLPFGSWVCTIRHPECDQVTYPVEITRRGHWDGVPPGGSAPEPIRLPPRGSLGPGEVAVPPGWFRAGGDPQAADSLPPGRVWVDGFVMHRFPVTNAEVLDWLNRLVADGRADEALRHAPRERPGAHGEEGALVVGFDGTRFSLRADADGDVWLPDHPALQLDWHGASAYLADLARRTGLPWRLPGELEWEKAARGVDGRWYPWGDHLDPTWCRMMESGGPRGPVPIDTHPVDESPYGVRGMAGNTRDWCLDAWEAEPRFADQRYAVRTDASSPLIVARGGSWVASARGARCAARLRNVRTVRTASHGFRGVRPWP